MGSTDSLRARDSVTDQARVRLAKRQHKVGALARKLSTIVKELEAEAPNIAKRYEEARRQAEIEHQRWLAECRERERREREQRRAAAVKASREQLLAIIDDWALARRVESFVEDAG